MTEGVPAISDEVIAKGWPDKVMFEKMSRTGVPSARPWTGAGLWSVRNRAARQVSSERSLMRVCSRLGPASGRQALTLLTGAPAPGPQRSGTAENE